MSVTLDFTAMFSVPFNHNANQRLVDNVQSVSKLPINLSFPVELSTASRSLNLAKISAATARSWWSIFDKSRLGYSAHIMTGRV